MAYNEITENLRRLSRVLTNRPVMPSAKDKSTLIMLESLKVDGRLINLQAIEGISPIICGAIPERIVVEIRKHKDWKYVTFWYFWSFDRFEGDHEDWEPATLAYCKDQLTRVDARVHDSLVSYRPQLEESKVILFFIKFGHTPIVKVNDKKQDVTLRLLGDNVDSTRRKWLDLCYDRAEKNGWQRCNSPKLEIANGPELDVTNWKKWGKHSIFLAIS